MDNNQTPEEIAEDLDIDITLIHHFTLIGGTEVIGEMFLMSDSNGDIDDNNEQNYFLVNPLKIIKNSWITEAGYETQHFFVEYNSHADGPFTNINKNAVVTISKPNEETIQGYLQTVYALYYPFHLELNADILQNNSDEVTVAVDSSTGNVIDFFQHYIKKRVTD